MPLDGGASVGIYTGSKDGKDMKDNYQSHTIEVFPRPKADSDRWLVRIVISWNEGNDLRIQPFQGPVDGFKMSRRPRAMESRLVETGLTMADRT